MSHKSYNQGRAKNNYFCYDTGMERISVNTIRTPVIALVLMVRELRVVLYFRN